jgi:transketolase
MRKQFANLLHKEMGEDENIIVMTGDLGYGVWDKIKLDFPDRFYNTGSSEQLMLGAAVGMALEGKIPFVYSITPFVLYRPFEFIRNYLDHEQIPVKLIGGGRDKDYGSLGFSHWAEEDSKVLSCFENIKQYRPQSEQDLSAMLKDLINNKKPSYINLIK